MRRLAILGLTVVVAATACGGDGLSADDQAISDAIFDQMMSEATPDDPFGETEARCFSDGVVRDIGVAELTALGLTAEAISAGTEPADVDLSAEQIDTMTDLMIECIDFRTVFVEEFTREGVSAESANCLADGFDDDFLKALARAELAGEGADPTGDPAQAEKFFDLITDCLSFDELSDLGG